MLNSFNRDESGVTLGSLAFMSGSDEIAVTRTRQFAQLRHALTNESYADLIAPHLQSVNSLRMSLDGSVMVTASATDKLQVWHLDVLREKLAVLKLDWRTPHPNTPDAPRLPPAHSSVVQTTLILSLAGFCVAALFALASLRRHREAIAGYLAAETKTAIRNRELEMAKVELMHSQKMQALGSLATGIAHDFNNLLSVIRMSNKLIGREAKTSADIQENVADIEQAVMQGKSVVGSMLGYARTEDAVAGPTDLSSVVEDTVSLLSKEFLSGIALTLELDRELPKVTVSRGRLEQVLLNLVVNASEAMAGNGKLKITLRRRSTMPTKLYALRPTAANDFVEMSVADSGPGIAPENQLRLFEPFFTTKRSGAKAGTGLGLSLVYSIAQQDGLGLSVESAADQGATFTIVVPVTAEEIRRTNGK
jgi:signal transduction histidine kinase